MRRFSLLLMTMTCCIALNAKTIQPVYFDDPSMDLQSSDLSPEQRSFFDRYVTAMERVEAGEDAEKFFVMEHTQNNDAVEPLLGGIKYNQGRPYNDKCPYINGGRAVTGCVATAMAMVMRYYKYPACGTGSFTYTGGDDGAKTINLEDYPFNWDNMLETYDGVDYTAAEADAVSTLMLACGASLNMNYSKDGSGANVSKVDALLKNNFYYSRDVSFISTQNSPDPDETIYYWGEDAVRPELQAGHPLIFAGFPSMGQTGHCFVIDGYKVMNNEYYYHVNWGWGGRGNCYCLLNRLEIDRENFSGYNLQMVYYIYPKTLGLDDVETENDLRATKILRDGQLIIERNNCTYTLQGQRLE